MVYRGSLENYWAERSRGFESLPLRQFPEENGAVRDAGGRREAAEEEG